MPKITEVEKIQEGIDMMRQGYSIIKNAFRDSNNLMAFEFMINSDALTNIMAAANQEIRELEGRKEWSVGLANDGVFIQSEDFTHDTRLYVNGDFKDIIQQMEYAKTLVTKLNKEIS